MEVRINRIALDLKTEACTLSGVIASIADAYPKDEVITRVEIDGREVGLPTQGEEPTPLGGVESLEFETEEIEQVVSDVLAQVETAIGNLQRGLKRSAALIIEGELSAARKQLLSCREGFNWCTQILLRVLILSEGQKERECRELLEGLDSDLKLFISTLNAGEDGRAFELLTGRLQERLEQIAEFCRRAADGNQC